MLGWSHGALVCGSGDRVFARRGVTKSTTPEALYIHAPALRVQQQETSLCALKGGGNEPMCAHISSVISLRPTADVQQIRAKFDCARSCFLPSPFSSFNPRYLKYGRLLQSRLKIFFFNKLSESIKSPNLRRFLSRSSGSILVPNKCVTETRWPRELLGARLGSALIGVCV